MRRVIQSIRPHRDQTAPMISALISEAIPRAATIRLSRKGDRGGDEHDRIDGGRGEHEGKCCRTRNPVAE